MFLKDDKIYIYCDGGCKSQVLKKVGSYGIVLRYNGIEKTIKGIEEKTTDNAVALKSIILALTSLKDKTKKTTVVTISKYVIDGIYISLNDWIKNDWKAGKRKIKNADLWQELYKLKNQFNHIYFFYCCESKDLEGTSKANWLSLLAIKELENENDGR